MPLVFFEYLKFRELYRLEKFNTARLQRAPEAAFKLFWVEFNILASDIPNLPENRLQPFTFTARPSPCTHKNINSFDYRINFINNLTIYYQRLP